MKIFFFACISLIAFCQMVSAQNNSPKGFAIYLLPTKLRSHQHFLKLDLKKLKPTGKPLISESDIQFYQKETHAFRIDYAASERLKKINDLGERQAFAVFVNDQAIYVGAFLKSDLSQSFDGFVIDTFKAVGNPPYSTGSDYPVLTLELGYPPEYFKSADLRADSRIFKALEAAGKLYEDVELVVTCKTISGTGKRRPSYVFTLPVVSVTKGEFDEKEITLELFDGKMLAEFDAPSRMFIGENNNFNQKQEVVLKLSKQVGKEKPDWFLVDYRKK